MSTGHIDTFARDNLPPREQWPEFIFELPELQYPEKLNCGAELVDANVAKGDAERIAIRSPQVTWTYRDLESQVNRIANLLVEDLGLVPGNRVLVPSPNSPMMAACMLAVFKAGGIAIPTMPLLRARELSLVIRKARVSHALCDRRLAVEVEAARSSSPALAHVRYFNDDAADSVEQLSLRKSDRFTAVATAADDVALLAFTSGTSGIPKATMHFHRDLISICETFPRHVLKHRADDIVAGTPSIAFTYGLAGVFLVPLRFGACAVLIEQYSAQSMLDTIKQFGVTVLYTVPTMYRAMTGLAATYELPTLRECVSAGEHLPAPSRAAWERATGIRIVDGIGSTEMCQIFVAAAGNDIRPGATGKPVPGYRVTVLDENGAPAAPGQIGRLAVKGPTGCRYMGDERQKVYVQNGWNVTGDAYYVDQDGYFFYQARIDDMIVSAGYNIGAPEVETALLSHPAVAECGVVGWPDEARGMIVKAFVVLKLGYQKSQAMIEELQEHVKSTIAPYKYPRAVEFVDTLPRTETGKLQRFKLRPPPSPAGSLPGAKEPASEPAADPARRTGASS